MDVASPELRLLCDVLVEVTELTTTFPDETTALGVPLVTALYTTFVAIRFGVGARGLVVAGDTGDVSWVSSRPKLPGSATHSKTGSLHQL